MTRLLALLLTFPALAQQPKTAAEMDLHLFNRCQSFQEQSKRCDDWRAARSARQDAERAEERRKNAAVEDAARRAKAEAARAERDRFERAVAALPITDAEKEQVRRREIWIGAPAEAARLIYGEPRSAWSRLTAAGRSEVWTYDNAKVTLQDRRVVIVEETR